MLFETHFPVTTVDPVHLHQFMEGRFKTPGEDRARDYLWGYDDTNGCVHVRSRRTIPGMMWREVNPVPPTTDVAFAIRTVARCGSGSKKKRRPVALSDVPSWLRRKFLDAGLLVVDADHEIETVPLRVEPRPIRIQAVRFIGSAVVVDADKFLTSLGAGIGDKKAYGFGYLQYQPL